MTTSTFYGATGDGRAYHLDNTSYANARATATHSDGALECGQSAFRFGADWYFTIREALIRFDTSAIGSDVIDSVVLSLYMSEDYSTSDEFITEVRPKTWSGGGLTTADFVPGDDLAALTLLASLDSNGLGGAGAYYPFVSELSFVTVINGAGYTELVLNSNRHRLATQPSTTGPDLTINREYYTWVDADVGGGTTGPKLVVVHRAAEPFRPQPTLWVNPF